MFGEADQPTHGERWQMYSLSFPQTAVNIFKSLSSGDATNSFIGAPAKAEERTPLVPKQNITPSPYIHYAVDNKKKKLGLAALTVLIFYEVSGGPFGIEDIVRAGGPFYALMGFSLLLVWAIPEALITAELSTAMPEASGSVAWVDCAFGPFWAFQKGWLSWLSGVSDNALYPILFLDCLIGLFSDSGHTSIFSEDGGHLIYRWTFIFSVTVGLTYLNYRGLDIVGKVAIVICLVSLVPFVLFCVLGAAKVDPRRWLDAPKGGFWAVDWRLLLNTFFWNINFWESAASFSGEVENPGKNYPIGMGIAVLLVFLSAFVPILVGTGASTAPYSEWTDGYFITLSREIVGPWLSYWLMLASALTNIGMFEAEMSSDSWQIAGMADRGILPSVLGKRSKHDTPVYGILLSSAGVLCLCWMSFSEVIDMLNLLFCIGQAIEFFAFLHLRRVKPDMPRPFKVGIGFYGMCVMLSFPLAFILVILYFSSTASLIVAAALSLSGVAVFYLLEMAKARNWCHFEDECAPKEDSNTKIEAAAI
ncbi:APC family permease [archaeon]|nr:MAG: APC family permease [archaeon]